MNKQPIETAPKDGRYIMVGAENLGCYRMRWNPDEVNLLVGPQPGLWVIEGGGMTWSDRDGGGPEWWAELS